MFYPVRSATVPSRFGAALSVGGILAFFAAAAPLDESVVPATTPQHVTSAGETPQKFAPDTPAPLGPEEQAAIREILELRRRQGSLLGGMGLSQVDPSAGDAVAKSQGEDEEEFARVLRRVVATAQAGHAVEGVIPSQEVPSLDDTSRTSAGLDQPDEPNADAQLIEVLRAAARQLDSRAADLEGTNHFRDADRLRSLSTRLRREARRWFNDDSRDHRRAGQTPEEAPRF
jgi:hypothetical protein